MKYFIILLLFIFVSSCSYEEKDIEGLWIPVNYPTAFPVYKFKAGKVSYYAFNNKFTTKKFTIKNNSILLKDLNNTELKINFLFDNFKIEELNKDTLTFGSENDTLKIKYERIKNLNFQKIDNIRIDYSNGWNYGFVAEINKNGVLSITEENVWEKIKRKGSIKIKKERLDSINSFSNYLFDNAAFNFSYGNCDDCSSYILTFEKNKVRKRFYIKGDLESLFPYILNSVNNQIKECPKTIIDFNTKISRLPFPHKPKTIIEKIP